MKRLLEEVGISFYLRDGDHEPVVVFTDCPERRGQREPALPFVDSPDQAAAARTDYLTGLRLDERSMPGRVTLRDLDFSRARLPLYAAASAARSEEHAQEQALFVPGAFATEGSASDARATPVADDLGRSRHREAHGSLLATRAIEALDAARQRLHYETSCLDLRPGDVFVVANHSREDISMQPFLVVSIELSGEVGNRHHYRGTAATTVAPFRPLQETKKPKAHGILSAVVVGPRGVTGSLAAQPGGVGTTNDVPLDMQRTVASLTDNEIYVDEHGRVRVQFPWDRDHAFGAESSIWMRVSQGWAGAGYGFFTVPRVGHEVLVAFLDGDVDAPIIIGRVHNGAQPVPHGLPANKTVSTWKSASSPGGEGFNEIRMDDAKGREHVYVQAERDMDQLVKRDLKLAAGGSSSRYVQGEDSSAVGGSRTGFVNANRLDATGMSQAAFVGLNRTTNVGVEDSTWVGTRWSVTVARGLTRRLSRELDGIAGALGGVMRNAATGVFGRMPQSPLAKAAESSLAQFGQRAFGELSKALSVFEGFEADDGPPPTSLEITDRQIKLSTGEASIVLDGPNVVITAQGNISFHAVEGVSILSDKEIAIAGRQKVAVVSATDDVIVQAKNDLHLNPYQGGAISPGTSLAGETVTNAEESPPCKTCGGAQTRVGDRWFCKSLHTVLDEEGTPIRIG